MSALVVDTHVLLWFLAEPFRLSVPARQALDDAKQRGEPAFVATITLVEIIYLIEKGRLPASTLARVEQVLADPTTPFRPVDLDLDIARTLAKVLRSQIPDMPDRIIAATALHLNLPLVSRDRKIQASAIHTIW